MSGDKIERSLNYIPQNRGYYNVVTKGQKLIRCRTAEETLDEVKKLAATGVEHVYVKIPSGIKSVALDSLRIA